MKNIFVVVLCTIFVLSSFTPLEITSYRLKTIVIDAGHGGKDPGCHGGNTQEADIALGVALELGRIINEQLPDLKVVYTRDTDVFVELHERAAIANKASGDLFISIHCNSGPVAAYGTETYVMGDGKTVEHLDILTANRENAVILQEDSYLENYNGYDPNSPESFIIFKLAQSAGVQNSISLAEKIEGDFATRVHRHSRGVKRGNLLVLWKTAMPSVLVETGFLTNKNEESYLNQKQNQVYMASGIYRAIKAYKQELED